MRNSEGESAQQNSKGKENIWGKTLCWEMQIVCVLTSGPLCSTYFRKQVWGLRVFSPSSLAMQITILKKVKQCSLAIKSSPRIESGWGDLRPYLLGSSLRGWAVCVGGSLGLARGNGTWEGEMAQDQREREAGLWCSHKRGSAQF